MFAFAATPSLVVHWRAQVACSWASQSLQIAAGRCQAQGARWMLRGARQYLGATGFCRRGSVFPHHGGTLVCEGQVQQIPDLNCKQCRESFLVCLDAQVETQSDRRSEGFEWHICRNTVGFIAVECRYTLPLPSIHELSQQLAFHPPWYVSWVDASGEVGGLGRGWSRVRPHLKWTTSGESVIDLPLREIGGLATEWRSRLWLLGVSGSHRPRKD